MSNEIRDYWDEQALKHAHSPLATTPDALCFGLELNELLRHLRGKKRVLDLGCGNGKKAEFLCEKLDFKAYVGVDFSPQMIKQALSLKKKLCESRPKLAKILNFQQGNVLDSELFAPQRFDAIFTSRCLINLSSFAEQKAAIKNVHKFLKKGGVFVILENTFESLENLNLARAEFALAPISVRWHNCYFSQSALLSFLRGLFVVEQISNFASTYYLISRTINAVLGGEKVDYNSPINALASRLPAVGDFSPMKCFVLRKK